MHIQKVLNSSVVLVQDDSGEESILLGKGIGYGGWTVEPQTGHGQPALRFSARIPACSFKKASYICS